MKTIKRLILIVLLLPFALAGFLFEIVATGFDGGKDVAHDFIGYMLGIGKP